MTTTPFLGCKISLISKSEIRYEGILYTIDPKESTIALAKVRSYGTEDRPAERQVQPRDEIFEYIIFRAADIKDLIVDDPPASIAPGLADPAIIQAHSTSTSTAATFPSSTFPQLTTTSSISASSGQRSSVPPFQTLAAAPTHVSGVPVSYTTNSETPSRTSTPTGHRKSPHPEVNQANTGKTTPNKELKSGREQRGNQYHRGDHRGERGDHRDNREHRDFRGDRENRGDREHREYRGDRDHRREHRNVDHGMDHRVERRQGQQNFDNKGGQGMRRGGQQNYRQQQQQNRNNYSQPAPPGSRFNLNRQFNNYNTGFNNMGFNSGQRRGSLPSTRRPQQQRISQSRSTVRTKEPIKFDGDFDFDKAEQEFKELEEKMSTLKVDTNPTEKREKENAGTESTTLNELVANNGGVQEKEIDNDEQLFYDKGKSFFDNISCESLERSKGNYQRIDWKAERKLNSETFGVPMSFRRQLYRGGYGSRGQYRNSSRGGFGSFNR